MRRRFDVQLALGQIPIERVRIPLKSRDELPPILAGLQWIFQTPEINEQVLALLESKVLAGKRATGRPGLDLWPILVLGVVRLLWKYSRVVRCTSSTRLWGAGRPCRASKTFCSKR